MRQVRVLLIIGVLALFASPALAALADDAFAWFVAPSGSDAAAGTMAAPFLTIQHAADQAVISPTKKRVIVSMGTYAENVVITGGVSLYGGFNAAAGWSRAKANTTTIAPTAWAANTYALFLTGSDNSVVDGFAIVGPDAPDESGGNAVAVRIHASSFVRLRYNEIHAGKGGSGIPAPPQTTPGLDGVAGTNGQPGCQGASCVGGSAGGGGFPGCSANWANGTNGGAGGLGGVNSGRGGYGDGIFGGMPGGSNTLCHLGASGGTSGAPGQNGSVSPGGSGGHRIGVGPFDALGWQAVEGNNGQVSFAGYGGYGGGGGGGGSAAGDASCVVDRGGGGGGGGSGGCPGLGGFAGGGGGASIAVLVGAGNTSYIVGNTIYAGDGGDGARGGDGALGGLGGAGGQGGTGFDDSGPGGNGGSGGRGGQGSGGGGGAGGYSNPILLTSGNLRYANALVAANGGAGGGGGAPFGGSGDPGGFFDIHYNGAASPAFMPILYVTKAGDGAGTVTSDIGWIDCGATCVQAYEGHGTTTVTLTAAPSASPLSVFVGWSGACTHAGPVCMVLMDASANDKTVTANFVKVTWPLSVSLAGNGPGSVGSSPGGIDCGATCGANFDDATAVTLTPNAGAHAVFAGWSGACTGTGACVVAMDAAKSVTASFALVDYSFNVSRSGTGSGGVVSSPAGIDCGLTCSAAFQALTPVTLTATPAVHSSFAGWSGACAGTGVCQVTMDAAKSVTASFAVITHTVTAAKAGTGTGSITSSPAGIGCGATCAASFVEGTQVTLTATPATGSTLTGWSGCDSTLANQCVVTAAPGATATATFTLNQYGVTPTAGPFGTISPDTTVNVNHGATTSFTVTPATGYSASVGGSCGGSLANGVYTTAPITAPCTVSATFAIKQYTVTPSAGAGGTISPDSPQTLNHGATTFFVVTPDPGRLALVGGTCGGALVATVYFTLPVTADCTVSATFPTLQVFELELQGAQVVPSVSSPAFGDGTVTYNPVTHELAFNLGVAGLSGTVGAGSMDVHGPAARGANAPALFTVPDGFPKVVTLTPQQETMLLAGQLYVDIHTSAFPGGQLRAQIDNLGAAQLFELFVSPRGSGEGQVTGTTDTGTVIDCYPDCEARLASGKVVTLTAIAQAGSIFRGWEADCTGTVTTCTVTMNAGKYVRARFDAPAGSDSAALVLTSSASPNPAATGKDVIVTFTVTNNGPAPAAGIYLDVTNPLDAAYVWSSPACELDFDTVYCEAPSGLAAGASTQFRVVYRPAAAGTMEVFAEAFADESDPDTTNNMVTLAIPVSASPAGVPIARYRLYSDVTKEHHFTTDQNEYNVLGTYIGTWVQEGTVGKVLNNPGSFAGVQAVPYYRLYDNNTRWHHWTTDANEFYTLGFVYSGWSMEGVDGYILPSNPPGTTQLYRLNYPALGALHHWTIDANEYNTLITSYGWVGEGGSGFVVQ